MAEHATAGATSPEIAEALFITVKTVEMHLGDATASPTSHRATNLLGTSALQHPIGANG